MDPQRHGRASERHSCRDLAIRMKSRVERGTQIADLRTVIGQPFGRVARFPFRFSLLENILVVLSMMARERFALAAFDQLLECVRASGVEQAIPASDANGIRSNK